MLFSLAQSIAICRLDWNGMTVGASASHWHRHAQVLVADVVRRAPPDVTARVEFRPVVGDAVAQGLRGRAPDSDQRPEHGDCRKQSSSHVALISRRRWTSTACRPDSPRARAERPISTPGRGLPFEQRSCRASTSFAGPKRTGIVRRQAGLGLGLVDRLPGGCARRAARVQRDREHRAGRASRLICSCSAHELGERRDREAVVSVDDRLARHVAEHVGVRRRAVDQAERDARVGRMQQRSLALDEEHLAAPLARLRARAARRRRR